MKELNWRTILLGLFFCVLAAAATPYVTLKLGQSVDLTLGGMFFAAFILGKRFTGNRLAIELNIVQTMINLASGIAFMVVILAAFYYIKNVFGRDIGFNPTYWQMFIWLLVSANLGVFMGIIPSRLILKDKSIPWPVSRAILSIAQTLTDPSAAEVTKKRRDVLTVTTGATCFLTFLRDGLGVITHTVGSAALNISFGLEFAAIGIGMLVPLSVGLSYLLGVWIVNAFGDLAAKYAALSGVAKEQIPMCMERIHQFSGLHGASKDSALIYLNEFCGKAAEFVQTESHFKFVVQWMMWPATAMMVAAALTSVVIPLIKNFVNRNKVLEKDQTDIEESLADETVPLWWSVVGITVSIILLVWLTTAWFDMSMAEVLLAIAIQPLMILAGLRVLGITGSGPVSLLANATQFLFGLIWPAQIRSNLTAAYISASPQSSAENVVPSFWVAQRIGGKFKTLILAQLFVIPIGALLTPLVFTLLEKTYGIGLETGQLSAPTGLKIATLAMVMERGMSYLPQGAFVASIVGIFLGVFIEILLSFHKMDKNGNKVQRFSFLPIPAALGFALILPGSLNLAMAFGSVIAASWRKFSSSPVGSYERFAAPIASGLMAGEAIMGSIFLPAVALLMEFFK